jgi:hypothetical protein
MKNQEKQKLFFWVKSPKIILKTSSNNSTKKSNQNFCFFKLSKNYSKMIIEQRLLNEATFLINKRSSKKRNQSIFLELLVRKIPKSVPSQPFFLSTLLSVTLRRN